MSGLGQTTPTATGATTQGQTFSMPYASLFTCTISGPQGSVPIQGLSILNQTNGSIYVFVGAQTATSSPDYIVTAGTQGAYMVPSANFVTLQFIGLMGNAHVTWTNTPIATGTSVVSVDSQNPNQIPARLQFAPGGPIVFELAANLSIRNYNAQVRSGQFIAANTFGNTGPLWFYVDTIIITGFPDYVLFAGLLTAITAPTSAITVPPYFYGCGSFDVSAASIPLQTSYQVGNGYAMLTPYITLANLDDLTQAIGSVLITGYVSLETPYGASIIV